MLKQIFQKLKKDDRGALIIEWILIFPIALIVIWGFIMSGIYIHDGTKVNELAAEVGDQVASQMRGSQESFALMNPELKNYIIDIAATQISKTRTSAYETLFTNEDGSRITKEQAKALLVIDDQEACDARFEAKENTICLYSTTVAEEVVREVVQVHIYSNYHIANILDVLKLHHRSSSTTSLNSGVVNPNF